MSEIHNVMKGFPKIVVALDIKKMNALTLCSKARGVKTTGDPDVVNPPKSDEDLQLQAGRVEDIKKLRVTDKKMSLTRQEEVEVDTLKTYYEQVGRYVQRIAREVAMATGSVAAGEAVVLRCGFKLKKKRVLPPRTFEVVDSDVGWTHLRVKAAGKNAAYVWRFGITHEKGVIPEVFMPVVVTMVCELVVRHPFSGKIIAYQVACILPKKRSSKTKTANSNLAKKAAGVAAYLGNKPVVDFGIDALQWSDLIYRGCR
ncbi:MAG: hypothetical protein WCL06_10815 [Bacteroidota bacterium]